MFARSARIPFGLVGLAACALLACGEPEPEPAPAPPAAEAPVPPERTPEPRASAPVPAPAPPAPAPAPPEAAARPGTPAPAPPPADSSLSLEELGQRIRQTPAIGAFSKLSLKNDLDDLVDGLRNYHARKEGDLEDLHQRYEALVLKLITLLEDDEPELALALTRSRERIWSRLVDPVEFAKLST